MPGSLGRARASEALGKDSAACLAHVRVEDRKMRRSGSRMASSGASDWPPGRATGLRERLGAQVGRN